MRLEAHRA